MRRLMDAAARVTSLPVDVLLVGEPGTGKRTLARWIHERSSWTPGSFLELGELEAELDPLGSSAETALSAHAATGAFTLFIPELGELSEELQRRLLGLLEERERSGKALGTPLPYRVIAATRREPLHQAQNSLVWLELVSRLSGVTLRLPPLRERLEDLDLLWVILQAGEETPLPITVLSPADRERLHRHPWPGNLVELRAFIQGLRQGGDPESLFRRLGEGFGEVFSTERTIASLPDISRRVESLIARELILKTLQASGGNRRRAAARLGISYRALVDKMRKLGIAAEGTEDGGKRLQAECS